MPKNYQKPRQQIVKKQYKKKTNGRRQMMSYGSKAGSMAYSAYKMALKLKKIVNVEEKLYEVSSTLQPDYNGILTNLNTPAQGIADNQRVGDGLKMQHLSFKAQITSVAGTGPNFIRFVLLFDDQAKVTAPSDVLSPATVGTALATISHKDYDKRFQTNILYDMTYNLDQASNATKYLSLELPIGKHTQFEGGTVAFNTGALRLITISNQAVGANAAIFAYNSRLIYTDN